MLQNLLFILTFVCAQLSAAQQDELARSQAHPVDSSPAVRDTLSDFKSLQQWIRANFKLSDDAQEYCSESMCSYGRTFKVNILFDLNNEGFYTPTAIDTKYFDVNCKYVERDVKDMLYRMPLVKADEKVESGSKMMMPITVML